MKYTDKYLQIRDTLIYVSQKVGFGVPETLRRFEIIDRQYIERILEKQTFRGLRLKLRHSSKEKKLVYTYIYVNAALRLLELGEARLEKGIPVNYEIF